MSAFRASASGFGLSWRRARFAALSAAALSTTLAAQSVPVAPTAPATRPIATRPALRDRPTLERNLSAVLNDVILEGTSQTARGDSPPGPARPERYRITSATKADGDWWLIRARIQYADTDVTLPVRLRVVWAEETPILTLDQTTLPGLGTYSAQVMIYDGWYSGVWSGKGYGGVLSGRITKAPAASAPASQPGR